MDTLGELVARERRSEQAALRADPAGRAIDYHDFCTTAWKAGNFLRYLGVRSGDRIVIADDAAPEPLLALFGTALLGGVAAFGADPATVGPDARVVVAPVERESAFDLAGGSRLLAYGGVPTESRTAHWEGDVWSENPAFPPVDVAPSAPALAGPDRTHSHADLLATAGRVVDEYGIDADAAVAVEASLTDPGVVAAGVLAPLLAGATVVFPGPESECTFTVGGDAGDARIAVDEP